MKQLPQRQNQNAKQEWLSALFTLLVLTGIYASMDNFSSYAPDEGGENPSVQRENTSVAVPYWNQDLGYGFRSIAGDTYTASGNAFFDTVEIGSSGATRENRHGVRVSYYKDASLDLVEKSLDPESPRAYSHLPHGIAVIEGDIDSVSAKTIFSTLHSR